ncbi:MAG TPA: hypothetical protein PLP07_04445 [Pyrinomonadaceae bacterium]|nr:hypothetical protein [Pyrinomonadaceae bacterium]HQX55153.1 hypothetical protein [Pyrinomonadaceae bacterium]
MRSGDSVILYLLLFGVNGSVRGEHLSEPGAIATRFFPGSSPFRLKDSIDSIDQTDSKDSPTHHTRVPALTDGNRSA